jgi:hypothetical protein
MTNKNPSNPGGLPEVTPGLQQIPEIIHREDVPIEIINGTINHTDEEGEWIDFDDPQKKPQLPS